MGDNGWQEWKNSVLGDLDTLKTEVGGMRKDITDIKVAVSALKVKSGFYGAIGGLAVLIGGILISLLVG